VREVLSRDSTHRVAYKCRGKLSGGFFVTLIANIFVIDVAGPGLGYTVICLGIYYKHILKTVVKGYRHCKKEARVS
jgi:hypothetical protein